MQDYKFTIHFQGKHVPNLEVDTKNYIINVDLIDMQRGQYVSILSIVQWLQKVVNDAHMEDLIDESINQILHQCSFYPQMIIGNKEFNPDEIVADCSESLEKSEYELFTDFNVPAIESFINDIVSKEYRISQMTQEYMFLTNPRNTFMAIIPLTTQGLLNLQDVYDLPEDKNLRETNNPLIFIEKIILGRKIMGTYSR